MTRFIKLDMQGQALAADAVFHTAVLDNKTGLIWDVAVSERLTYQKAEAHVAQLGGGRRLPTLDELESIRDITRCNPAINTDLFPETPSAWHWTSSPFAGASGCSWVVYFGNGHASGGDHGHGARVRAVRSAPAGAGQ